MLQSSPCILLAGNDAETLASIKHLIIKQQQNIDIAICAPVDILQQVSNCQPVIVLFCPYPGTNPATANIKQLRDDETFDEVPLYIYNTPPAEEDLKALLEKLPKQITGYQLPVSK